MSSEDMGLVSSQRLENGLGSHHHHHHHHHQNHIVFQDDEALRFNCGAPAAAHRDSVGVPKTRDLSGFIDERFFAGPPTAAAADFHRGVYGGDRSDPPEPRNWTGAAEAATASVDGSDEDEEEEEDDDEEEEDDDVDEEDDVDGKGSDGNIASNGGDKIGNGKQKGHNNSNNSHPHHQHHFGSSSRDEAAKESGALGTVVAKASPQQPGSYNNNNNQNVVTVAENNGGGGGDRYFSHFFQGAEGSSSAGQKDLSTAENGCGFSGRKDGCAYSNESLRAILSDPVTGALMDDAIILPCGHSFGGGGIQHIIRTKSCYACSQSISEDSAAPNLSLRAAVQAFRREEELQFQRSAKRKRERFDQDKGIYGDSTLMELPRGRGVQFPFAVTDRVIIKGNKRTPQRFVGREAVVTTQCLNGWYVVKTLDNAESVKLQYRSLAKVPDDTLAKPTSSKMAPNWV